MFRNILDVTYAKTYLALLQTTNIDAAAPFTREDARMQITPACA